MVLGTSKKQTTQARRLSEKFKVKERLKLASSKTQVMPPLYPKKLSFLTTIPAPHIPQLNLALRF